MTCNYIKSVAAAALLSFGLSLQASGQCQQYAEVCSPILKPYTSDGQFHRALLQEGETAEFAATFYKGNTYRVVACTGPDSDTLRFKVLDSNYQEIFSSDDYDYPRYWDFRFNATDRYYIQGELMEGVASGCGVILIGFKE
ncbi:MAG TPA: hypothetical protein VI387_02405, partial [Candidatus Brocadiales bacterium]|nr:hypothetical protein [Candidatus Brocadiales bacterium]